MIFRRMSHPDRQEFEVERYRYDDTDVYGVHYHFSDALTFESLVENPRWREAFEVALAEFSPDLVHVHHLTCMSTTMLDACEEARIPVVMSLHDFWLGCPRGQRLTSFLSSCEKVEQDRCTRCYADTWPHFFREENVREHAFERYHRRIRRTLDQAERLITPSPFSAQLYEDYGVARAKMTVIPYGLPRDSFPSLAGKREEAAPRVFGYIGTLLPSKGVHVLIDAFLRLMGRRESPGAPAEAPDLRLEVHGAALPYHNDSQYSSRLERMAQGCPEVVFKGRYEPHEVASILAGIDVLVVPSIWFETWGIVVREAFLASVPVIVSDFGALGESVEEGKTGLRFARGDASHLCDQMRRCLVDPDLRSRLASSPKQVWSTEENAQAVVQVYREIFDER